MYLAEAQRLSHSGCFGWDPASGEFYWSDKIYRIANTGAAAQPDYALGWPVDQACADCLNSPPHEQTKVSRPQPFR
jgi:hypothetical protein